MRNEGYLYSTDELQANSKSDITIVCNSAKFEASIWKFDTKGNYSFNYGIKLTVGSIPILLAQVLLFVGLSVLEWQQK